MTTTLARTDRQPMAEMNTTPLIDVMLVLLIMFIITIPVATHVTPVDLPTGITEIPPVEATTNRLAISADDRILWNEQQVSEAQLAAALQRSVAMPIEPELQFEPQPQASYALAARVTRLISVSGVTKFGFVGNERYSEFGKK